MAAITTTIEIASTSIATHRETRDPVTATTTLIATTGLDKTRPVSNSATAPRVLIFQEATTLCKAHFTHEWSTAFQQHRPRSPRH